MKTDATNTDPHATLVLRDKILGLLSDEELGRVSSAEDRNDLAMGDEYIDLQHLDRGVQQAFGPTKHEANLLPRNAVHETTWQKIQTQVWAP